MTRLLAPITALQNSLDVFIQACPESSSRYFPYEYAFLRRNIQRFQTLMAPFGHDETVDWIIGSYRDRIATLFTMIVVHIQLLPSDRSGLIYTPDQQAYLDEIDRHVGQISQILAEVMNLPLHRYSLYLNTGPADQLLSMMFGFAMREAMRHRHIKVVIPPSLPPISYYPIHLTYLIDAFIMHFQWILHRQGHPSQPALVEVKAEEVGVAIVITFPHLCLDQISWERFLDRYQVEAVYELGGSIEPLTWDEGYGQGVILRLPWAKPS